MDNDERLALLESKVAAHETLICKLVAYAQTTAKGRLVLKLLGLA
jgi:hypothetical protein